MFCKLVAFLSAIARSVLRRSGLLRAALIGTGALVLYVEARADALPLDSERTVTIVVTGFLDATAAEALVAKLDASYGAADVVVRFDRCLGGTLGAAVTAAKAISRLRPRTVAIGQCTSACAMAFIAGSRPTVDVSAGPALIGFHNARQPSGLPAVKVSQVTSLIEYYGRIKLSASTKEIIHAAHGNAAGLMFYFDDDDKRTVTARKCDGTQGRDFSRCELLPSVSPAEFGIRVSQP